MIEDNSYCPKVTTYTIDVVFKGFWRHIDWTTYVVGFVLLKFVCWDCEAEVSVFVGPIFMEDVSRFDISVHEASTMDIIVAFDELLENFN